MYSLELYFIKGIAAKHLFFSLQNGTRKWSETTTERLPLKISPKQSQLVVEERKGVTTMAAVTTHTPSESFNVGVKTPKVIRPRWTPGDAIVIRKDIVETKGTSESTPSLSRSVASLSLKKNTLFNILSSMK